MTPRERAEAEWMLACQAAEAILDKLSINKIKNPHTLIFVENIIKESITEHVRALLADDEETIEAMAAARYQVPIELSHDNKTTNYWAGASNTVRQNEMNGMRAALAALRRKVLGE
jgi:hypothetical protein